MYIKHTKSTLLRSSMERYNQAAEGVRNLDRRATLRMSLVAAGVAGLLCAVVVAARLLH